MQTRNNNGLINQPGWQLTEYIPSINVDQAALICTSTFGTLFFFPMILGINPVKKLVDITVKEDHKKNTYDILYCIGGSIALFQFIRLTMIQR